MVDVMEKSGYITPSDITPLINALRILDLAWIETSVRHLFEETVVKGIVGHQSKQIIEGNVKILLFAKITSSITEQCYHCIGPWTTLKLIDTWCS